MAVSHRALRRLLVRTARLAPHRSLIGEILGRQLLLALAVGAIALAILWLASSWAIERQLRQRAELWIDNLDELGMPLYVENASGKFTGIENYVNNVPEIAFVRYYSPAGEPIFADVHGGREPGVAPLAAEALASIAGRAEGSARHLYEKLPGETAAVRLGKPIWTRSLRTDGLLGFDAQTSAVDEVLVGYVEVGLDFTSFRSQLLATAITAMLVGASALLLLTAAFWTIGRKALLPLVELQAPLRMLARGRTDLSVAPPSGHRELVAIADAVNATVNAVKERDERLSRLANFDPLTGLINRERFFEVLEREIASTRPGRTSALLLIDLDQFKYINDTFTHAAGDRLLAFVATLLRRCTRPEDTVARFGGDEFLVLVPNVGRKRAAAICAALVKEMQSAPFVEGGRSFTVRTSIGATMLHGSPTGPAEALSQADMACHTAKANGRNRFHFYDTAGDEAGEKIADVACSQDIEKALRENGFVLHYQPVVDVRARAAVYYEVLVRMQVDAEELVMPSTFLPVASCFGLMTDIDRWVLRAALQSLVAARAAHGDVRFTLNISGSTFDSAAFFDFFLDEVSANNLPLDAVVLEITEQVAVRDLLDAGTQISELARRGCRFAIDDFGAGYCSYGYLKTMPVDFVKIDGSFIRNLRSDEIDQKIVKAIVEIAGAAEARTIAEHVEDYETFVLLGALGVDFAQGYFLGKPAATLGNALPAALLAMPKGPARRRARAR